MKKRKRYNHLEHVRQLAKAKLKGCAVVYVSGDDHKRLFLPQAHDAGQGYARP